MTTTNDTDTDIDAPAPANGPEPGAANGEKRQAEPLPARLEAGLKAPDFTLPAVEPDGGESQVTLSDLTGAGKKVLLYFYPAAMTPGCTTEACDFRDNIARLSSLGYTVLGVSKDPIAKLQRFRERDHLSFPLLSDPDLTVHRRYAAYGEKKLYGRTHVGVIRSTFAIDGDGVITLARYNVRAKGHVDSLLRKLG
ncbi:peroxiredoxin [Bifidobacterium platyrrhinorum]|uniref:thioredoxin-dependent peroxiredoxin n=1 Tax=Bifidobacterium platyrrhinorum TaxID=2661628 RepID=A0A6L9SSJ7_9BIFI|nr:peroxiredoxin [Bifidobacterium platyrrhinorum]NEG54482.1 redoxin domain-containing protein [Bifidobacterium platyrrhinorum]